MADIFDLALQRNKRKQQSQQGYSSPWEDLPLQVAKLIATRDKDQDKKEEEGLIEADRYVKRLNLGLNRLTVDPLTGDSKIYDNGVLTRNQSQGRQMANQLINLSPKSTQYIESAYQRWEESFNDQINKNSKMIQINNKMNTMIDENGDLDKIESIFKGLQEGDMSLPYIKVGKDGKMSRNEAFSEIAKITNYLKENEEFIKSNAENPLFASMADNFNDSKIVSSFFSSQLVGLNEASDTPLLTDKERGALEGWAINGDPSELLAMTKDTYAQADKYEKGIETSLVSSLTKYKEWENILNNVDKDKRKVIKEVLSKDFDTNDDRIAAMKEIEIPWGASDETDETKMGTTTLHDLRNKQFKIIK